MKMNKKIAVAGATLLSIVTFAACAHKSDVLPHNPRHKPYTSYAMADLSAQRQQHK